MIDDSPTTQMRLRRASSQQISLAEDGPRHEPLTAARGIMLGVVAGGLSLAVILLCVRAVWKMLS